MELTGFRLFPATSQSESQAAPNGALIGRRRVDWARLVNFEGCIDCMVYFVLFTIAFMELLARVSSASMWKG